MEGCRERFLVLELEVVGAGTLQSTSQCGAKLRLCVRSDRQSRPAGVKVDRSGSTVLRAKHLYSAVDDRDEMASRDGRRAVRVECHARDTVRQCPWAIGTRAVVPARVP